MSTGGPFSHLRTSEVMRRAAGLLKASDLTIDHQAAAELEVRAIWIERARNDDGLSLERRLGVAAIEDVGGRPRS